jgi:alpha-beta hydrolase superfamily lysophospholipase
MAQTSAPIALLLSIYIPRDVVHWHCYSLSRGISDMKLVHMAAILLLGCAVSSCSLDNYLFNDQHIDEYALPDNTIPDSLLTHVTFESGGNTLYGIHARAVGSSGLTVLYCHGNKHHIDEYWDRVMLLHEAGLGVFIFDYRGFGRSEGTPSEAALYEDAEAALTALLSQADVTTDSIVFYGYSLGNVSSIHLAANVKSPVILIAEVPFASATSLLQGGTLIDVPKGWLTDGEFDNAETIRRITSPLLLFGAGRDATTRFRDNGRVVYENAPDPKKLVYISESGHTGIPRTMGHDTYRKVILDWIDNARPSVP